MYSHISPTGSEGNLVTSDKPALDDVYLLARYRNSGFAGLVLPGTTDVPTVEAAS
jgi:hypothetical protein